MTTTTVFEVVLRVFGTDEIVETNESLTARGAEELGAVLVMREQGRCYAEINPICGVATLCADDIVRPCALGAGHAGYCGG